MNPTVPTKVMGYSSCYPLATDRLGWILLNWSKKVQRQSVRVGVGQLCKGNEYQCLKDRLESD